MSLVYSPLHWTLRIICDKGVKEMIYNDSFKMSLLSKFCEIQGDYIVEIQEIPGKEYNPFDYYGNNKKDTLYYKFIAINESNNSEVLDFIRQFGFLGLDVYDGTKESIQEYSTRPRQEKLSEIKKEIQRMRLVMNLWDSMSFDDYEAIENNTIALHFFDKDPKLKQEYLIEQSKKKNDFPYYTAFYMAKFTLAQIINEKIAHVRPYIAIEEVNYFLSKPKKEFTGHWHSRNLLSTMYTMIYMDFVQGKLIRKCRSTTCPEWFEIYGNDDRKIYCSPRCANTQGKRNSRKAKKKEERE